MRRAIAAGGPLRWVPLFVLLVTSPAALASDPGEERPGAVGSAGAFLGRVVRGVASAIDDVRGRAGVRRIPFLGKAWRPQPTEIPPIYDELFPHSVEVCTMTQYVRVSRDADGKVVDRKKGGWGGHATMYLHGACLDTGVSYPRLTLCPDGRSSGVGVSVNQVFANVNWMGFPGRDLFLRGNLPPDVVLDEARFDALIEEAATSGLFDGIRMRQRPPADPGRSPGPRALVDSSIGTDFGLTLSRTAYCSRLPVPRDVLAIIVDKLNALNEQYALSGRPYEWDLLQDNCSHAIHNALAAAGVWEAKLTRLGEVEQLTRDHGRHVSFPFNTVVALAEVGNHGRIDGVEDAFEDDDVRRPFDRFGWIPTGAGALVETHAIRDETRNRLFVEGAMPFAGSVPIDPTYAVRRAVSQRIESTLNKEKRFRELFSRPAYGDLLENLETYRGRYARILERRDAPPDSYRAWRWMDDAERSEFDRFRERFYTYIDASLADVDRMIGRVHEVGSPDRAWAP